MKKKKKAEGVKNSSGEEGGNYSKVGRVRNASSFVSFRFAIYVPFWTLVELMHFQLESSMYLSMSNSSSIRGKARKQRSLDKPALR